MTDPARELAGFFSLSDPRQEGWWQEWDDNDFEGGDDE